MFSLLQTLSFTYCPNAHADIDSSDIDSWSSIKVRCRLLKRRLTLPAAAEEHEMYHVQHTPSLLLAGSMLVLKSVASHGRSRPHMTSFVRRKYPLSSSHVMLSLCAAAWQVSSHGDTSQQSSPAHSIHKLLCIMVSESCKSAMCSVFVSVSRASSSLRRRPNCVATWIYRDFPYNFSLNTIFSSVIFSRQYFCEILTGIKSPK